MSGNLLEELARGKASGGTAVDTRIKTLTEGSGRENPAIGPPMAHIYETIKRTVR